MLKVLAVRVQRAARGGSFFVFGGCRCASISEEPSRMQKNRWCSFPTSVTFLAVDLSLSAVRLVHTCDLEGISV